MVISYTKFEHFGSFVFELCSGQTDKQQTNKQTEANILSMPTDSVGVDNNSGWEFSQFLVTETMCTTVDRICDIKLTLTASVDM